MASKCGQTHTESGNQTDAGKKKPSNQCKRGVSHPVNERRRRELRDLCAQNLDLDHMKHRAVGGGERERETEVESEGKRGSRWVSHLVDGRRAREMKRRGRVCWRELDGCEEGLGGGGGGVFLWERSMCVCKWSRSEYVVLE